MSCRVSNVPHVTMWVSFTVNQFPPTSQTMPGLDILPLGLCAWSPTVDLLHAQVQMPSLPVTEAKLIFWCFFFFKA